MTTGLWAALGLGAAISLVLSLGLTRLWTIGSLTRDNYAGRPVPAVLGLAFVAASVAAAMVVGGPPATAAEAALWGSVAALLAVGILDDRAGSGPRGIAGHLRSLAHGRPTTGVLKLVVGAGAAAAVAVASGASPGRVVAGFLLMATSVNLFNALDVVPGRSLKWAIVVLAAALAAAWGDAPALVAAGLGAAAGALAFDLREWGMLGDGGSNPLGLLAGAALFLALPTPGVAAAAVLALLLQLAAETVTISRLIRAAPPLRWFDGLGRR